MSYTKVEGEFFSMGKRETSADKNLCAT